MFLGHYAVGLASKKVAPTLSLGTLFIAGQLVDLLWPIFLLLGLEHVRLDPGNTVVTSLDFYDYPLSHSLLASILWSVGVGLLFYAISRNRRSSFVLGAVVFSHWILDLLAHRPDLPLGLGGETYFGLGLWNSLAGTVIVETGLLLTGVLLYLRSTEAMDRIGSIGFWALVAVLVMIYVGNITGPPPPNWSVIAIAGNASWLFVLWAYWVDKHRRPLPASDR